MKRDLTIGGGWPDSDCCPSCFYLLRRLVKGTERVGGRVYCDAHAAAMVAFLAGEERRIP